jgi:hypothetical protein
MPAQPDGLRYFGIVGVFNVYTMVPAIKPQNLNPQVYKDGVIFTNYKHERKAVTGDYYCTLLKTNFELKLWKQVVENFIKVRCFCKTMRNCINNNPKKTIFFKGLDLFYERRVKCIQLVDDCVE